MCLNGATGRNQQRINTISNTARPASSPRVPSGATPGYSFEMARGVKIRVKSKPARTLKQTTTKESESRHSRYFQIANPNRRDPRNIYRLLQRRRDGSAKVPQGQGPASEPVMGPTLPPEPLTNKARHVHIK